MPATSSFILVHVTLVTSKKQQRKEWIMEELKDHVNRIKLWVGNRYMFVHTQVNHLLDRDRCPLDNASLFWFVLGQ